MKDSKIQSLVTPSPACVSLDTPSGCKQVVGLIIPAAMLLLCIFSLNARSEYVKGFPGIHIYPGAGTLLDEGRSGTVDEDGYPWVWYEFKSRKLRDEWDNDAVKLMEKIINFYKIKFKKPGWQYIGEGVQRHHWVKGKKGIAIGFAADYVIAYVHMSNWDARTNVTKLGEKEFMRLYVDCAKAVQKIYERQGIKSGDAYAKKMLEVSKKSPQEFEKFENKTKSEIKKTVKDRLRYFRISLGRFKELKSEYGDSFQQYMTEHSNDYLKNQVGFMAIDQM